MSRVHPIILGLSVLAALFVFPDAASSKTKLTKAPQTTSAPLESWYTSKRRLDVRIPDSTLLNTTAHIQYRTKRLDIRVSVYLNLPYHCPFVALNYTVYGKNRKPFGTYTFYQWATNDKNRLEFYDIIHTAIEDEDRPFEVESQATCWRSDKLLFKPKKKKNNDREKLKTLNMFSSLRGRDDIKDVLEETKPQPNKP